MNTTDSLIGTLFDERYRVERRIGAGGMANVYLAEDETLGRPVAIKVLHERYNSDDQFIERFLREASAAARLNHPNIVQVYDRGEAAGTYYIAMEYVDGMTLKDLVRKRGQLTEPEVLNYSRQALSALRFAHRNGIVHRDVKPHNLMVDHDGRLKIADFGIARAGADQGLTEAGSIVGTAQYLSPEQARGHDVSAPSDLYSLGVVMFEMATGGVPFDGDSPVNVALKHVNEPVPRPSSINPEVAPHVEAIILRAMQKDPALRYGSADEMLQDLEAAKNGHITSETAALTQVIPAQTTQVTQVVPSTALKPPPRQVTTTTYSPGYEDERYVDPEDEERTRSIVPWLLAGLLVLALLAAAAYAFSNREPGVAVPDVRNQLQREATAELEEAGFVVGDVTEEFSTERRGWVLEQDPGAGEELAKGDDVDLVVSKGPEPVDVPDVVGDTRAEAIAKLEAADLVGVPRPEPSDDVEKGRVIRSNPEAGSEVRSGSRVTIVISQGPAAEAVPSVVGLARGEATAKLEAAGFEVDVSDSTQDGTLPEGDVAAQSPAQGTEAQPGSTVTLTLASGSNVVPDVVGSSPQEASGALEEAGFSVETVEQAEPGGSGNVIDQEPGSGQRQELGSTVRIVVATATAQPEPPPEPQPEPEPVEPPPADPAEPVEQPPAVQNGNGNGNGNNGNGNGNRRGGDDDD